MKIRTKTIKGWANNSDLLFSPNTTNEGFQSNLKAFLKDKGYTPIRGFDTLRGKNATEKLIIKAWYWRGSWSGAVKQTHSVYYK